MYLMATIKSNIVIPSEVRCSPSKSINSSFDHSRLLGPDVYGANDCPPLCGCVETPVDCPRWYDISHVQLSCSHAKATDYDALLEIGLRRRDECLPGKTTSTGGWCLISPPTGETLDCITHTIILPHDHRPAASQMSNTLVYFISEENVESINDFGAGVGQYKAAVLKQFTNFSYNAYDGAGNIESFTKGFVSFFDLTVPLYLPITDWVLSLAVGEHIPSRYEGMVIRNLHRHNRKGIILMWASLGYPGFKHINNHSNKYLIDIFLKLGYTIDKAWTRRFRRRRDNHHWFSKDTIVFRRNTT